MKSRHVQYSKESPRTIQRRVVTYNTAKSGHVQYSEESSRTIQRRVVTYNTAKSGHVQNSEEWSRTKQRRVVTYNTAKSGHVQYSGESSRTIQRRVVTYNTANRDTVVGNWTCTRLSGYAMGLIFHDAYTTATIQWSDVRPKCEKSAFDPAPSQISDRKNSSYGSMGISLCRPVPRGTLDGTLSYQGNKQTYKKSWTSGGLGCTHAMQLGPGCLLKMMWCHTGRSAVPCSLALLFVACTSLHEDDMGAVINTVSRIYCVPELCARDTPGCCGLIWAQG